MSRSVSRIAVSMALVTAVATAGCSPAPAGSPTIAIPPATPGGGSNAPADRSLAPPPTPPPAPSPVPGAGPIAAGTYRVAQGSTAAVGYQITLPDGWIAENGGQTISKHPDESGELFINPFVVDDVFADPCGGNELMPVGPRADDLATALLAQPGPQVSGPSDIELGGFRGTLVELAYPDGLDPGTCDPPIGLQVWHNVPGDKYLVLVPDGRLKVHLADFGSRRLVLVAGFRSLSTAADLAQQQTIIDSIVVET